MIVRFRTKTRNRAKDDEIKEEIYPLNRNKAGTSAFVTSRYF